MKNKERIRRAIAAGLDPETATEAEILEAEKNTNNSTETKEKNISVVNSSESEEDTNKIFNLPNGKPSDKKAPSNKVITDPVKAWGVTTKR